MYILCATCLNFELKNNVTMTSQTHGNMHAWVHDPEVGGGIAIKKRII